MKLISVFLEPILGSSIIDASGGRVSNAGFRCGLSGVMLQLASIPVSLYGHGLLATLLASVGLSLTYLGLRSMALSRDASLLDDSYRYLAVSLIAYALITALVSTIFFGSGASLQMFALITVPVIVGSQVLYFLGYGSLTHLRSVDVGSLCRALKVLGIMASLVAGAQLVTFVAPPGPLHALSMPWFLLSSLTLFASVKGVELVTWAKLKDVDSEPLGPRAWLFIASATLLLIGASGVVAETVNAIQIVAGTNEETGFGQQVNGVNLTEEVIKAYTTNPTLLTLTQYHSSLTSSAENTEYVTIKPPYQALTVKGCPMVDLPVGYPIMVSGEARIHFGWVNINEYVYRPGKSTHVNIDEEVTHEIRVSLINSTMLKEFRAAELSIRYSTVSYDTSQAPSLEIITGNKVEVINLPTKRWVNASEIHVPVNTFFSINLIVLPPKIPQGLYVIDYTITATGQYRMQGVTHLFCKCLASPTLTPTLPPYAILSGEALNSNLILIPYPLIVLVIGLVGIIAYVVLALTRELH